MAPKVASPTMVAATARNPTVLLVKLATSPHPMGEAAMVAAAVTAVMVALATSTHPLMVSMAWAALRVKALAASPHPKRPWRTMPRPRMKTHPHPN